MNRARKILSVLLVAEVFCTAAPSVSWGESNVPNPGVVFPHIVNPKAQGKKVSGFLTVAFDFDFENENCLLINNMYVVATMERRNNVKPFNLDFDKFNADFAFADPPRVIEPFCFDNQPAQEEFVLALFREYVIPHFFGPCDPGVTCPTFAVKSIKDFLSSGTGAISMEIRLAVQAPDPPQSDD